MTFGQWHPLTDAAARAPHSSGVFQIKIPAGLVHYPRGKSAMIHYELAGDLREAIARFAETHPDTTWLCRISVTMTKEEQRLPQIAFARLLERFKQRFGSPPRLPPARHGQ